MFGILVALFLSLILLKVFDKGSLKVLGLSPSTLRAFQLFSGVGIALGAGVIYFGSVIFFSKSSIGINPDFGIIPFLKGCWWVLKSVLFEEFLFRGVLLFLVIKYLGGKSGCVLSGIAFGIYHWFSYGIFGQVMPMITIFLLTGIMGWLWAYCFFKTGSMYFQTGLHFGWNLTSILIFSQGPLGDQLVKISTGQPLEAGWQLALFLFQLIGLPGFTLLFLRYGPGLPDSKGYVTGNL